MLDENFPAKEIKQYEMKSTFVIQNLESFFWNISSTISLLFLESEVIVILMNQVLSMKSKQKFSLFKKKS